MGFDPASIAILGAVGAGVSAAGTLEQGIAAGNEADYQSKVAGNNAIIAKQNAAYSAAAGAQQAQTASLKGAATSGRIKAAQAANGIDVNSGSAVDVDQSQAEENKLDTLTTENNALLKSYGYQTTATSEAAQSGLLETQAEQAPLGAAVGAGGSLLSNASGIGFRWLGQGQSAGQTTPGPGTGGLY